MSLLEVLFPMSNWLFFLQHNNISEIFLVFTVFPLWLCPMTKSHLQLWTCSDQWITELYYTSLLLYFIACLVLWSYLLGSFSGFLASHVSKSVELFQDCKQQCTSDSGLICISILIFKKRASNLVSTIIHFHIFFYIIRSGVVQDNYQTKWQI